MSLNVAYNDSPADGQTDGNNIDHENAYEVVAADLVDNEAYSSNQEDSATTEDSYSKLKESGAVAIPDGYSMLQGSPITTPDGYSKLQESMFEASVGERTENIVLQAPPHGYNKLSSVKTAGLPVTTDTRHYDVPKGNNREERTKSIDDERHYEVPETTEP